jgi:hypothetical protein
MADRSLTGNPFVDVGLGIAAKQAGKHSVDQLTSDDLQQSVRALIGHIPGLQRLKVLSKYWQNNPIVAQRGSADDTVFGTVSAAKWTLQSLSRPAISHQLGACQVCGDSPGFSTANRSWFPLAGTVTNDPTTLPNFGGKLLCADCFRSVVLIPLGCRFCSTGPYFFHVTDAELQTLVVDDAVTTIRGLISSGVSGSTALMEVHEKLRGRIELLRIVSGSVLWDHTQKGSLPRVPQNGATMISFDNGQAARLFQLHLPAQVLEFFAEMRKTAGAEAVFNQWLERCNPEFWKDYRTKTKPRNEFFERICDDIEIRRSVAPLVRQIVVERTKKQEQPTLRREEKQLLRIYEDKVLDQKRRFATLEGIAAKIRSMDSRYRDPLIRQLRNIRTKDKLLALLCDYNRPDKTGLSLSVDELRALDSAPDYEITSLLYLLCVAQE